MKLHTKYQGSRPYGFRQEYFFNIFPYLRLCRECDPEMERHNLNKLGRSLQGVATYQYQDSSRYGLKKKSLFSLYKAMLNM